MFSQKVIKNWNSFPDKTNHFVSRKNQRDIPDNAIKSAYSMGKQIRGNGCVYHILTRKVLAKFGLSDKWQNITVVTSSDRDAILTVYKHNKKNLKYFRIKKSQKKR